MYRSEVLFGTNSINLKKESLILLALIVLLGALLRFYALDFQSLWTDEIASWEFTRWNSLKQVFSEIINEDTYPPVYYIILYFTQKYFGDSELVLRLPSAICGIICIIAIFFMGTKLYSHKEGIISAALMAILWCPIYYSQEARPYIFLILFSILSVYFLLPIVKNLTESQKPPKIDTFFYIATASLCCYTHYFGGYLIALQATALTIFFVKKRNVWVYIFFIYFSVAILFLPWIPVFFQHIHTVGSLIEPRKEPITIFYYFKFLGFLFGAQKSTFIPLKEYSAFDVKISIAIILFSSVVILSPLINNFVYFIRKRKMLYFFNNDFILFLWLTTPFLVLYLTQLVPKFSYFYLLISLPAAYLLASRAITTFFPNEKLQVILTTLFLLIFATHLFFYKNYYVKADKEQFREAVNFVAENDNDYRESTVLAYTYDHFLDYYFQKYGFNEKVDTYINRENDKTFLSNKIDSVQTRYVWLISAHIHPENVFFEHLLKRYKIIESKSFLNANVWLFEKISDNS